MSIISSHKLLEKAYCGLNAQHRRKSKLKIRIVLYVEIKHKVADELYTLQNELLKLSIGATVRIKSEKQRYSFIRIHGIQNCKLISPYIKAPEWWKKALQLFLEGEHCQRSGIQRIIMLRPNTNTQRISNQELVNVLMDLD